MPQNDLRYYLQRHSISAGISCWMPCAGRGAIVLPSASYPVHWPYFWPRYSRVETPVSLWQFASRYILSQSGSNMLYWIKATSASLPDLGSWIMSFLPENIRDPEIKPLLQFSSHSGPEAPTWAYPLRCGHWRWSRLRSPCPVSSWGYGRRFLNVLNSTPLLHGSWCSAQRLQIT